MRRMAGLRDDRGATLVEFALVVPVVLVLLIACIDFARVLNASVTVQNASREAARYATLSPQRVGTGETREAYETRVLDYVKDRVVPLDPSLMTLAITPSASTDPRCTAEGATSCTWAAGQPVPTRLTVRVSYPWRATAWVIGPMLFAATTTSSLSASASMESMQ
jgi:Flp pilus assembly protein TadG